MVCLRVEVSNDASRSYCRASSVAVVGLGSRDAPESSTDLVTLGNVSATGGDDTVRWC